MLTTAIASILLSQQVQPEPEKTWFMFFLKGDGKRPSEPKELEKMQADHIGNLQAQGNAGHLIAAGPLDDPTKIRRGITVAIAKSRAEVDTFFKTDPYVTNSIMTVAAIEWDLGLGQFRSDYNKNEMEEYELLLTDQLLLRSVRYQLQKFAVGGRTKSVTGEKYRFGAEVWISRKADHKMLAMILEGVAAPHEIVPLWMAKGLLKPAG